MDFVQALITSGIVVGLGNPQHLFDVRKDVLLFAVIPLVAVPEASLVLAASGVFILPVSHDLEERPAPRASTNVEEVLVLITLDSVQLHDWKAVIFHSTDGCLN